MSNTALTHFQQKLQPTSNWGQAKKDCITEFGHTYILSVAAFQTSSYILRWGSPMTCNKKIWTWRRRQERKWERLHALEKRAWKMWCKGNTVGEKQHLQWEKSCNTAHVKRKNSNDLNILLFHAAAKTSFSALIFSPFISFTLALVSPLNFKNTPMSS